jgi:small-conductance mechanosensitive channel
LERQAILEWLVKPLTVDKLIAKADTWMEMVKKRCDTEGINIPFPQQDVHIYHHNQPEEPESS